MSDYLSEFRSEVPLPDEATMQRVCATQRAGRPRARLALVAGLGALVLAAVSIAAVKEVPWWQSGPPAVDPQAVVSVARDNMPANVDVADARTVATADDAALVAVPLDTTGYCLIPALEGRASLDDACVYQVAHTEQGEDDIAEMGIGAKRWIAFGRITDPRAAKIDLGAFTVDLVRGGFFLAQVPEAQWSRLSDSANPGAILDSAGHVLRRGCVNWGPSPATAGSSGTSLWLDATGGDCKPQLIPPPPTVDLTRAQKLFDVTLTQPYSIWKPGQTITFETAPASDGSTCVVTRGPGLPDSELGHGCTSLSQLGSAPLSPALDAELAHADGKAFYSWAVTGVARTSAGITRLELQSPSAAAPVTYRDGFFFAQLPVTTPGPAVGALQFPDGPWVLTGYDDAGHEVAKVDLNALHERASPH